MLMIVSYEGEDLMNIEVEVIHKAPSPKEYVALRMAAGLSPRNEQNAAIALKHSIFSVSLRKNGKLVGMGRIIGDNGCFYQVVDIAVSPDMQGKGLGKIIMENLIDYIDNHVPTDAYVSLIADVPADQLYQKFDFEYTAPNSVGMYRKT